MRKLIRNEEITEAARFPIINNINKTVIKQAKTITLDVKPTSTIAA